MHIYKIRNFQCKIITFVHFRGGKTGFLIFAFIQFFSSVSLLLAEIIFWCRALADVT